MRFHNNIELVVFLVPLLWPWISVMWFEKEFLFFKIFPHWGHSRHGVSKCNVSMCLLPLCLFKKSLPQIIQLQLDFLSDGSICTRCSSMAPRMKLIICNMLSIPTATYQLSLLSLTSWTERDDIASAPLPKLNHSAANFTRRVEVNESRSFLIFALWVDLSTVSRRFVRTTFWQDRFMRLFSGGLAWMFCQEDVLTGGSYWHKVNGSNLHFADLFRDTPLDHICRAKKRAPNTVFGHIWVHIWQNV